MMKRLLLCLILIGSLCTKKQPFDSNAESSILMEVESKRILYGQNIDEVHLTASIAKIMTAIVAIENGDLNQLCLVDQETVNQVGSSIYLTVGDRIKLIDLLYGLMLRSGNDAAYLIAKSVAGDVTNFVKMMNDKAKVLKMTSSVFNNPSGLDEDTCNYSTARDMAILMAYNLHNDVFRKIAGTKSYRCTTANDNTYVFSNKHRLVQAGKATGGKTGYTKLAKRTLVTSFKKQDMELVVVSFNCGDDFNLHQRLADFGFNNFQMVKVFNRGIIDIPYYPHTPIIYQNVYYLVGLEEDLTCEIHMLNHPQTSLIGKIYLIINNQVVMTYNVYWYY